MEIILLKIAKFLYNLNVLNYKINLNNTTADCKKN